MPSFFTVCQSRLTVGQHLGAGLLTGVLGRPFYPEPSVLIGGNPDEKVGTPFFVVVVFAHAKSSVVVSHKRRADDFVLGPVLQILQDIPAHIGELQSAFRHTTNHTYPESSQTRAVSKLGNGLAT